MKYVLLTDKEGRKVPILFPDSLTHIDVAEVFCRPRLVRGGKVVSAGFVGLNGVTTTGYSESLDVESRELDAAYIMGGDAVAYMPEPIVGNLLAQMRKRNRPKASVKLVSELGPEPVPSHAGPAFVVHWTLSIEGVVLGRDSQRRVWKHRIQEREAFTKMEHAPSDLKAKFEELCQKLDAVEFQA